MVIVANNKRNDSVVSCDYSGVVVSKKLESIMVLNLWLACVTISVEYGNVIAVSITIVASHDENFLVIKRNNKMTNARCKFSLCRNDQLPLHGVVLSKQIEPFDRVCLAAIICLSAKDINLSVYIAGTVPISPNL